jgi:UDP-3-O-[3-hydroxymyristoyl] glucosamine N-acyltransferase
MRQQLLDLAEDWKHWKRNWKDGIHEHSSTAVIAPDARIAEDVEIGPYSIVGPASPSDETRLSAPTS